ncbi:MAG: phospho-N-acetylmuramoyl-pentapeptide-transferase [bacterium]|nr:phospho-N-acetylmuramoyl-pentapeptide-transferase [bacterium]
MMYFLYVHLVGVLKATNVLRYITIRAGGAAVTAFVISILVGPHLIRWLYRLKVGQEIRKDECPPLHLIHKNKQGTPTIGGLLIITAVTSATLVWARWDNLYVWLTLGVFICLGALGFADDYLKVRHKRSLGLNARAKLIVQSLVALAVAAVLIGTGEQTPLYVPLYKHAVIQNLGLWYVLLAMLVIVGASNAVNLTDGLDGLAVGTVTICALAYTALAYVAGHAAIAKYLFIMHTPQAAELTVFCAALVGAGLGFLWYNAHPAMVFMGDTGSLALGGAIGVVALLIRKEVLLLVIGAVFALEAASVIMQVASFRLRNGKRIFRMAPIHHHFEMRGWPETRVTIRFWILALICALIGIASLKLQ